jgi:integrase
MKLTQASIERLSLPAGKSEAIFFDEDMPGFGLRIREGGSRTFIVQYALGGRQRRMTIGSAKILKTAKARETAGDLLAKVRLGHDPAADRAEARVRASDEPLSDVIRRFLARQERRVQERRLRRRTYVDAKRYLERYWKPLHTLHPTKVSRATVAARLGKIADDHGLVSADRARAALSAFFTWAIGEGLCDMNPVIGTNKHFDGEKSRDRVLTDRELAVIWRSLPDSDYGAIVQLLILTGQRREEIGALQLPEVDLKQTLITLPPERTKNGRPHEVPLSKPAVAILKAREKRAGRDFVFGDGPRKGNGADEERHGGFQGWSKSKTALDEQVANEAKKVAFDNRVTAGPWRLHDIRRTVATRMAELGVQPHIIEAVLNHVSGHKAGVAGVYNRSSYAAEKRIALDLWGKHVQALVEGDRSGDGPRVVKFPARAKNSS